MSVSTLRAASLNGRSLKRTPFTSSHWPDYTVEVRSVTGARKLEIAAACKNDAGDVDSAKLVLAMIIDCVFDPETGERVYSPADVEALMNESAAALDELWNDAVAPINGYGAKEETEKNSTTPTSSSPSPSPVKSAE